MCTVNFFMQLFLYTLCLSHKKILEILPFSVFNWCVYSQGYREHSRLVGQAVGWLVEWLLYANEPCDEEAVYFER